MNTSSNSSGKSVTLPKNFSNIFQCFQQQLHFVFHSRNFCEITFPLKMTKPNHWGTFFPLSSYVRRSFDQSRHHRVNNKLGESKKLLKSWIEHFSSRFCLFLISLLHSNLPSFPFSRALIHPRNYIQKIYVRVIVNFTLSKDWKKMGRTTMMMTMWEKFIMKKKSRKRVAFDDFQITLKVNETRNEISDREVILFEIQWERRKLLCWF
jgi:hypothetical protein